MFSKTLDRSILACIIAVAIVKMPKTSSFKDVNAKEQIQLLVDDELWDALFYGGGVKYTSLSMKNGIDVDAMSQPTLLKLIKVAITVDPRGGYIRQADVFAAIAEKAATLKYQPHVHNAAVATHCGDVAKYLKLQAYRMRVVFAHFRETKTNFTKLKETADFRTHPKPLRDLYDLVEAPTDTILATPEKEKSYLV